MIPLYKPVKIAIGVLFGWFAIMITKDALEHGWWGDLFGTGLFGIISFFMFRSAYYHGAYEPPLFRRSATERRNLLASTPNKLENPQEGASVIESRRTESTMAPSLDMSAVERDVFFKRLANSIEEQDTVMMVDISKVLSGSPAGSSVIALRRYRGAVQAGVVVLNGDIGHTVEMLRAGALNPRGSPDEWKLVSKDTFDLLSAFTNPPEAALAFFVMAPSGRQALAFTHLVRGDGELQWVSEADVINRVGDALSEAEILA
jgi:hypothetical protein